MANLSTALKRVNGMLRLSRLSLRIRERRHSQWLSVYQILPGGGTRERAVRGYAAADPETVERLYEKVLAIAKDQPTFDGEALSSGAGSRSSHHPCWPEICAAVVAFQRGQGMNMNLVGPFKGQGYFRLLPPGELDLDADLDRAAAMHGTHGRALAWAPAACGPGSAMNWSTAEAQMPSVGRW